MSSLIYGRSFQLDLRGWRMRQDGPSIYKFSSQQPHHRDRFEFYSVGDPYRSRITYEVRHCLITAARCNLINFDCEKNGTTINFIQLKRQLAVSFQFYLNKRFTKKSRVETLGFHVPGHKRETQYRRVVAYLKSCITKRRR